MLKYGSSITFGVLTSLIFQTVLCRVAICLYISSVYITVLCTAELPLLLVQLVRPTGLKVSSFDFDFYIYSIRRKTLIS
uniref:Uncharacterized protein n=1 Tax=Arundo donax TaxID=35708 RepID=A0A0A9BXU7_ARUDO